MKYNCLVFLACSLLLTFNLHTYTKQDIVEVRHAAALVATVPTVIEFFSGRDFWKREIGPLNDLADQIYKCSSTALESGELVMTINKFVRMIIEAEGVNVRRPICSTQWDERRLKLISLGVAEWMIAELLLKPAAGKITEHFCKQEKKRILRRILGELIETLINTLTGATRAYTSEKLCPTLGGDPAIKAKESIIANITSGLISGVAYEVAGELILRGAQDDEHLEITNLHDLRTLIIENIT